MGHPKTLKALIQDQKFKQANKNLGSDFIATEGFLNSNLKFTIFDLRNNSSRTSAQALALR